MTDLKEKAAPTAVSKKGISNECIGGVFIPSYIVINASKDDICGGSYHPVLFVTKRIVEIQEKNPVQCGCGSHDINFCLTRADNNHTRFGGQKKKDGVYVIADIECQSCGHTIMVDRNMGECMSATPCKCEDWQARVRQKMLSLGDITIS